MARKAIVDKEIILDLLKKGETTQRIAERFKVSRQAIDLHRKEFINNGLLPDKRASRSRKVAIETVNDKVHDTDRDIFENQPVLLETHTEPPESVESLDAQIDLIINAFNALKRLTVLEKELETIKQENEAAKLEIERLKAQENKRLKQEKRWMLINTEDMPDT